MRSSMTCLRGVLLAGVFALVLASPARAQMRPAQPVAPARMSPPLFQVNPALLNPSASATSTPMSMLGSATLPSNPSAASAGMTSTGSSADSSGGMSYNPYGSGSYYCDPYGGYFRGVGDLITSYGKYYNQSQGARMKSVQVEQAKIDLRKALFDEWRYYRSQMPTAEDVRQGNLKRDLNYARHRPDGTDILNASSLNALLAHLKDVQAKGLRGPGIDLAARLASALGVEVAELLPMKPDLDDLTVTRRQAKKLFDELVESEDRAVLLLLTQLLARLAEATNR